MKTIAKVFLLTPFIVGLFSCVQKRPAVIERPVFDVWNSTTLEIDKIEMSDSATGFYIDAYFRPNARISISNETYIRENGGSEKFLITQAEGINLDEETIMPESGTISFRLFFPALKRGITKIDFIENNYKIWGIYLLPNAKIKFDPIPKDVAKPFTEPLPKSEYNIQPAQVSGRLLGFTKGMEHSNITITAMNPLYFKRIETALSIAEDGYFSGEITPGFPGIYQSSAGLLFLAPGKETKLYVDLKKRSRFQSRYRTDKEPGDSIYTYISGNFTSAELETINQTSEYFSWAIRNIDDHKKLWQDLANITKSEELKQYMLDFLNQKLDEIKQKGYSANMQMMMENAIKFNVYYWMMDGEGLILNANYALNSNNFSSREESVKFQEVILSRIEKTDDEYYSFLNGAFNDNMSYIRNFLTGVGEYLSVHRFLNLPDGHNKPIKERLDYFKEKWALVSGGDILYNVVQAQFYGMKLARLNTFTDTEKQEIYDLFRDKPIYAESLIAESDRMEMIINATKEGNEGILNESPNVSQEQMFDAIIAKYKGKVVVIDIWGTWCPPCLVAIKTVQPLKEEMKGKDVVWVYIADGTSPLNTWKQTSPGISGEHYYVSSEQTRYWGINAYPTYMVYDRQGKQLTRFVDYPGNDVMKTIIEKGL